MKPNVFDPDFQNEDLDARIVSALERVGAAFRVMLWRQSYPLSLSPIQTQILVFVQTHKDDLCTVSYLASEFNMSKPTLSGAVQALIRKGLLRKVPSSRDQRSAILRLTPEGEKLAAQAGSWAGEMLEVVRRLDVGCEKEQLLLTLLELIRQLQRRGVIAVQRMCFQCVHYRAHHEGHVHYCQLMGEPLQAAQLRMDCPEFEEAVEK